MIKWSVPEKISSVQIRCVELVSIEVPRQRSWCMMHMVNMMQIVQMCEWFELVQAMTSLWQVRAGSVRNASLGVEKLIEEHLPSTLSEYILFETVLWPFLRLYINFLPNIDFLLQWTILISAIDWIWLRLSNKCNTSNSWNRTPSVVHLLIIVICFNAMWGNIQVA